MLEKRGPAIIITISILVPLVVIALMALTDHHNFIGLEKGTYPLLHAIINGATAVLLITGFILIKAKNKKAHRIVMTTAFVLSAIFLVSYVISKFSHESTEYGGNQEILYFFILITHIILSGIILPLVLYTMYFAWNKKFDKHKKIVKWTFPIWLYVAITGVLVYVFMQPYY